MDGLPFGYEVFAGNRNDATTVEEIVEVMEERHGKASRVWVMDRGMVSDENLEFFRDRGIRYLVGASKSMLRKFEKELLSKDWEEVMDGLKVRACAGSDGKEIFVLCRSRNRCEKEKAMHERFEKRIVEALERIQKRLNRARKKVDAMKISRQIGRILERNQRAAGLFEIQVEETGGPGAGMILQWSRREKWAEWATLSEGCYMLRTNLVDRSAVDLWKTYMHLTDVEDSFRTIKTCLDLRPVWHQTTERVQAHILVAFLAYATWKTLQKWSERAGLGSSVRTLLGAVSNLQATDVILQTTNGREIRIPSVSAPEKALAVLLQRLGLSVPRRLAPPGWILQNDREM